jgi:hypothetical protein
VKILIHTSWLLAAVLAVLLSAQPSSGAADDLELLAKLANGAPCKAIASEAWARGIPMEGIDPMLPTNTLAEGDSITALVSLCQKGGRRTQWLLYLQVTNTHPAPEDTNPPGRFVMYSSLGTKLEFPSRPVGVLLNMLGPVEENKKRGKIDFKSMSLTLNQGYLALGLDQASAAILRLKQTKIKGHYALGGEPFKEEIVATNRAWAKATGFAAQEEHSLAGAIPALISYFEIAQNTPGLKEILFKLVDLPSLWSIAKSGGIQPDLKFDSEHIRQAFPQTWGFDSGLTAYELPINLTLNRQPALHLTFVAAPPQPPLLACAGVWEMMAENPRDKDLYLTMRVISGKCPR